MNNAMLNNAMIDQKPRIAPGYTGRHDDPPAKLTAEQAGILGFIAGLMLMLTIILFVG
jgi:hypothetical protein